MGSVSSTKVLAGRSRRRTDRVKLAGTGAFLGARPFRAGSYRDRAPLMREIRRDGVDL